MIFVSAEKSKKKAAHRMTGCLFYSKFAKYGKIPSPVTHFDRPPPAVKHIVTAILLHHRHYTQIKSRLSRKIVLIRAFPG